MCSYIIDENSNPLDIYFETNIYTKNGKNIYGKVKKYYNYKSGSINNLDDKNKNNYETLQFILDKTSSKILKNNYVDEFKWNWENKVIHRNSSIIPMHKIGKLKRRSRPIILNDLYINLKKIKFISKNEYKLKLSKIKYIPKLLIIIKYINMNLILDFNYILIYIKSYLF